MLSGVAGRLITGPLAFLIAGILDLWSYLLQSVRGKVLARLGRRRVS
jgi:hypothetical protein